MLGVGLSEDGADGGGDHLGRGLRDTGEDVAHEVHAASLPRGADEHRLDRGLQPEVVVRDHQLHTGEPAGPEAFEERGPERPVFAVANVHAQDLPVAGGGHPGGDHHGPGHDPAVDAALEVGGIREHVRELDMVQGPGPERLEVDVELLADP